MCDFDKSRSEVFCTENIDTGSGAVESEHLETVFADLRPNIVEVS
jgi:hypothetical protein